MSQHKARQGRRDIYLGEKFKSWVSYRGLTIPANFVSLSREGLGVAVEHDDGNEFDLHAKVVVKVTLTSRSEFSFSASVRNIEKFVSVGKKYMRIGLEIDHVTTTGPEGFTSESGHAFFPADSAIKPLCSGISPLFFKDRIVFNTIGFTLHGMIVQPQGHKKFLLPGQQITIKLTLPGGKGHTVKTQVSVYLVKNPTQDFETAYYLTFAEHKERLIHDIVAYLLSFTSTKEPASLVTEGFPINHLGGHVDFDYGKVDTKFRDQHQFSTSPIGIAYSNYQLEKKSRGIHMWLNGRIIAGACLNFVKADESRQSTISRMGGSLPRKESESSFVELYNLFFNPQFPINSFFVPLLQHCIRAAIESKSKYLMICCHEKVKKVLIKVGFKDVMTFKVDDHLISTMKLALSPAIHNHVSSEIELSVWKHIFSDLHDHLAQRDVIGRSKKEDDEIELYKFRRLTNPKVS